MIDDLLLGTEIVSPSFNSPCLKASADLKHVAQQRGEGPEEGLVGPHTPAIAVEHHVSELIPGLKLAQVTQHVGEMVPRASQPLLFDNHLGWRISGNENYRFY